MDRLVINGGRPLNGEVTVSGAKNAAVAIIPAALLIDGVCRVENIPNISDVIILKDILTELGAKVDFEDKNTLIIDSTNVNTYKASYEMVSKMRASYYLLGALLGRFKKAEVSFPGGCDFGFRPIDQHIKGFEGMGAKVSIEHGTVNVFADKLIGGHIYLDVVR